MSEAGSPLDGLDAGMVAVLGVPFDGNSSFLRGAAQGPEAIRAALRSPAGNLCCENGLDLGSDARWRDVGDVQGETAELLFRELEDTVAALVRRGVRVMAWGGDHSITYPLLRAHASSSRNLTVLHFDAHPDLYDDFEGNRLSHASPFARIMEEGLARRLVQVGIRTLNPHQRSQAEKFDVEIVDMRAWRAGIDLRLEPPVYVSLDLDGLDPAFAPGVSHREPGGLSTRDVLSIVQALPTPVVGSDVVELNPVQDPTGVTALVAAKISKELIAAMLA